MEFKIIMLHDISSDAILGLRSVYNNLTVAQTNNVIYELRHGTIRRTLRGYNTVM